MPQIVILAGKRIRAPGMSIHTDSECLGENCYWRNNPGVNMENGRFAEYFNTQKKQGVSNTLCHSPVNILN